MPETATAHRARLFLSQEEWDRLPERLSEPFFAELAERNRQGIGFAEERAEVLAGGLDHRGAQSEPWRIHKVRLLRNAVAWYLERDEAALARCRAVIAELLEPDTWATFYDPDHLHHFDLKVAEACHDAAFALDVLGAQLDEATRAALIAVLRDVGLPAYLAGHDADEWWARCDFNWASATHGNAGIAALAIREHAPELADRVLERVRPGLQRVIDAFPAGGGWTEGMMYATTTLQHLTDFVVANVNAGGDDLGLIDSYRLHEQLDARLWFVGGDGELINPSNCRPDTAEYPFPGAYWWAERCGRPDWTAFEDAHQKRWDAGGLFHDVMAFWLRRPGQPSEPARPAGLRRLEGLQWAIRQPAVEQGAWLFLRAGDNGGNHNHRDLGSIILGFGDERILADAGYGAGATELHNALTVGGQQQTTGAVAPLLAAVERDAQVYLACELDAAYPHRLALHRRHLLLIDERHLLIVDDCHGRRARRTSASLHFLTGLAATPRADGIDLAGARSYRLRILAEGGAAHCEPFHWHRDYTRISIPAAVDRAHTRFALLVSRDPAAADAATWSDHGDRVSLRIDGRVHQLDLAAADLLRAESI